MLTGFDQIFAELAGRGTRKRMVAAWGVDGHTIAAASKAVDLGLVDVTLVGEQLNYTLLQNNVNGKFWPKKLKFFVYYC